MDLIGMEVVMVSVIIPTYNRENTIKRAIYSVLNQIYQNLECIVVDDGSSDNTREVLEGINDPRFKFFLLPFNHGPAYARNYGVNAASGDYIAFQDSDDVWHLDKLEKQIKKIESDEEYGMVYSAYSYKKNSGKNIQNPRDTIEIEKLEGYIFDSLLEGNKIGTPTILIRKDLFIESGGFNEALRSHEDWEFVIRFSEHHRIGYIPEILVDATYSDTGVNSDKYAKAETYLYILKKYKDRIRNQSKINCLMNVFNVIEEERDIIYWKDKLIPDLITYEYEFDCFMKLLRERLKYTQISKILLLPDIEKKAEYFMCSHGIRKETEIAVYGASDFGIRIAEILKKSGYNINCLIDRKEIICDEFGCVRPYEIPDTINIIIVTIFSRNIDNLNILFDRKRELISIFDILRT